MNPRCTVCNHPLIDDINLAVLSGDYSLKQLSQKFGPSRDAFHRHKRHLEKKMLRTQWRLENHRKQVALLKLDAFLGHVEKRLEAAAAAEDTDRVYKGAQIGCRLIQLSNKMDLPLEPETAYRLLAASGPATRDSILPAGPHTIADLHQALVDLACGPCPPPEDDEAEDAADRMSDRPDLEKDLHRLLASLESKPPRRQTAKTGRQADVGRESEAHPAALETSIPLETNPTPCLFKTENRKLKTCFYPSKPATRNPNPPLRPVPCPLTPAF